MYTGKEKQAGRGASNCIFRGQKFKPTGLFDVSGPSTAEFIPNTTTKSGSTNLPEGTVHVYRQCNEWRQNHGMDESNEPSAASASETVPEDGLMLGVLAVPAWMTPSDFLAFVALAAEGMAHLRLIRPSQTLEFAEAYNGKPFNSMDPETCHIVRVLSVEIESDTSVPTSTAARLPHNQYTNSQPVLYVWKGWIRLSLVSSQSLARIHSIACVLVNGATADVPFVDIRKHFSPHILRRLPRVHDPFLLQMLPPLLLLRALTVPPPR
ncbi:hypothetical protein P692DRAFT_20956499 [Suillus brevipes Sb2]|nr:hypothetical protein P692DRAFT_20956499 [Suillus brevipes Sb2]